MPPLCGWCVAILTSHFYDHLKSLTTSSSKPFYLLTDECGSPQVHETPSEESVTLMGKDIEIRIAFKGQAKALRQFRTMLVPAGSSPMIASPSTGNASGSGNPSTTITTIREESPDEAASSPAQDRPTITTSLPQNGSEEGGVPTPSEVSSTAGAAPLVSTSFSVDSQGVALGGDSGRSEGDSGKEQQQEEQGEQGGEGEGQVGGVEETETPEVRYVMCVCYF